MKFASPFWCATALAFAGCHHPDNKPADAPAAQAGTNQVFLPSQQAATVSVEPAQACASTITHLNGRLTWNEDATVRVFTPFAGRVVKILAEVGQKVSRGDVLAEIASPDFGQAQSEARRATSDFVLAERNFNRLKELFEHGAAAEKDLHSAQADYERSQSEQMRTAARLAFYGGSTNAIDQVYLLKSPLDGVVVERSINPGQEVRADAMLANAQQFFSPLFIVTDPSRLWIQVDATEHDLPQLEPNQEIVVRSRAYPNQVFAGKIDLVSAFLDPSTRTIKVRGSVQNNTHLLKAEMFVSVDIHSQDNQAAGLDVPEKAVFSKGEKRFLFVEESPGRFERHEVKVGPEHDGKVMILDGLRPGQRVVTEGSLLLDQMLAPSAGS